MNFLIQTVNDQIVHDFAFTLLESIKYHTWYTKNDPIGYRTTDRVPCLNDTWAESERFPKVVPIGNTKFVCQYIENFVGPAPKPINVPRELMDPFWTGRKIFNGTEKDIWKTFFKSNDIIKVDANETEWPKPGNYQISEPIDIVSEWRAFVFRGELVGLQNYSGAFAVFPDVERIRDMIAAYKQCPPAYTLDVAVIEEPGTFGDKGTTVVIEVHDFFSCGLYGFADHRILPYMFNDWFHWYRRKVQSGKR